MKKIALLTGVFCLLLMIGCKKQEDTKEDEGTYIVTSPMVVDTVVKKEYVAQIQSQRNIEIRALEKGYLESINVDEGQHVKAGQVLFRIMPNLYKVEYLKAEAVVKEAQLELLNSKTLADKDIVSKSEPAIAQAKLEEAKADLELAKLHLLMTEIKAPFDGIIDRIPLKLGSLVDEGALLTTLSDNKSVYAYFNVPEDEYLNYRSRLDKNGQPVCLILANNEEHKCKGAIEAIEGQFDNETGNIAFRAKFPNPDLLLRHGETGKIQMKVPVKNALIIPQKATYELQDRTYVYVIDKDGKVTSRHITVSNSLPGIFIVGSGLKPEDRILFEGIQSVNDGAKVKYVYKEPGKILSSLQLLES